MTTSPSRSQSWLDALLWLASAATSPTLSNLFNSPGITPPSPSTIARRGKNQHITRSKNEAGQWVLQLTRQGALTAIGGRNPDTHWSRPWDSLWRFVLFDIPKEASDSRTTLHRWFRQNHFACLQGSVWISPDPLKDLCRAAKLDKVDPQNIVITEGSIVGKSTSQMHDLVSRVWNFPRINKQYDAYLALTKEKPAPSKRTQWREREHQAWRTAIASDPLLPEKALPSGYLGKKAWQRRQQLIEAEGASLKALL
jgi:DNA-binding transcriptional regulator PaaX